MICPLCGTPLEQDFGVVTCGSCHAVLSVDLDGTITVSGESHAPQEEQAESPAEQPFSEEPLVLPDLSVLDEVPVVSNSSDLKEVIDFANSETESHALSYTVVISEVNSGDAKKRVFEALQDPRFQWNASELMAKMKNGRVTVESISPAKAAALVLRLRGIPVKVTWLQQIYS